MIPFGWNKGITGNIDEPVATATGFWQPRKPYDSKFHIGTTADWDSSFFFSAAGRPRVFTEELHCCWQLVPVSTVMHWFWVKQKGLDWTGLDWTGLDWSKLEWIGLESHGLDWTADPSCRLALTLPHSHLSHTWEICCLFAVSRTEEQVTSDSVCPHVLLTSVSQLQAWFQGVLHMRSHIRLASPLPSPTCHMSNKRLTLEVKG